MISRGLSRRRMFRACFLFFGRRHDYRVNQNFFPKRAKKRKVLLFCRWHNLIQFLNNFPRTRHNLLCFFKMSTLGLNHSLEKAAATLAAFSNKGRWEQRPFWGYAGLHVILAWMTYSPYLPLQNAPKSMVQLLSGAAGGHISSKLPPKVTRFCCLLQY